MGQKRKKHSDEFKARIALEAVKGIKTLSEISSANRVHPNAIGKWKRQLVVGAPAIFSQAAGISGMSEEEMTAPLYEEIGRLKVENNWLKKKL
jgi:putative transposase